MDTNFPKYTPNPLLQGLPEYLKDPKNYMKVKKIILETLATKHSHSDVMEYANCVSCSKKMLDRRVVLKKLGFKSPMQYREWEKVIGMMLDPKRVPLRKYNT